MTDSRETLAAEFEAGMFRAYEYLKSSIGYQANYFLKMLREHGGVETAKRLLAPQARHSDGFLHLAEKKKLEWSVEAWALRPQFRELFQDDELEQARRRLRLAQFDVDHWEEKPWESG